jgi:hypothetical protein
MATVGRSATHTQFRESIDAMNMQDKLDIAGLEKVYDALALAIDQAGSDKSELFLVKLALLNAKTLGDPQIFESNIATALKNL